MVLMILMMILSAMRRFEMKIEWSLAKGVRMMPVLKRLISVMPEVHHVPGRREGI